MSKMYYSVGVRFNTTDTKEKAAAERWLTDHMNIMIGDEIGCFHTPDVWGVSIPEDGTFVDATMVRYELRDEGAFDRYVANWADKMRNDRERPKCIDVVVRYVEPRRS